MDQGKGCEEGQVHERRHFKNRDRMPYDLQEGELYSVHYDQRKELGRGKFGVVYHVKVRFRFQFNIKKIGKIGTLLSCSCSCVNEMVQDKETDRCYAAKHIRIRKPEQKEKVEL